VWKGWHAISPPIRADYARYVELGNKGARELGYKDMGALWRSKYDMAPDDFARGVGRLWTQVKPFYDSLHAYVRWKLREKYGPDVVPEKGPIPAHLLGNMWAQEWGNIYPLGAPRETNPGSPPPRAAGGGPRPSGSARSSSSRRTATWCATPAPGTSTASTTCASRCASRSTRRTSPPSTTSWGTTSTSARPRGSPP